MTLTQAKSFINQLGKEKLIYHFDDDAVDCLYETNKLTTLKKAEKIQDTINSIYEADLDWGKYGCPIGYALYVLGERNGNTQ